MSIDAWADTASQDKYRQDPEHQRAIEIIKALLQGKIDSDSAATTIASVYDPLLKRGFNISLVATLWDIICEAVRALGGNKDIAERQVSLLNSISKLPDVTDEHGNTVTPVWGVYWKDLLELAIIFREYGIHIEPMDNIEEQDDDWDAQAVPLLNATTFGAMYLAHGRQPIGMTFHAEISLMNGIEVPCFTAEQQRRAAMYVPPAATWAILAGESIYELCKTNHDRKDASRGSNPDGGHLLWGGNKGYSLGRWTFWKVRFGEIAEIQALKDDIKAISAGAAREMESIEMKSSRSSGNDNRSSGSSKSGSAATNLR